jgi:hypothetical protein
MAKRSGNKKRRSPRRDGSLGGPRGAAGIPNKASIVATDMLVSPKGRRYTILETDQVDPYDEPAGKEKKNR